MPTSHSPSVVRVECGERNGHIRRVDGNTRFGGAKNRMISIEAVDRVTSVAQRALVTVCAVVVIQIGATCPLQEIAADGRHVADLR